MVSVAVLPDPTTTNRSASASTTSLAATARTSSSTAKGAGSSAGIEGEHRCESTTRQWAGTSCTVPSAERNVRSPAYSEERWSCTRPVASSRSSTPS